MDSDNTGFHHAFIIEVWETRDQMLLSQSRLHYMQIHTYHIPYDKSVGYSSDSYMLLPYPLVIKTIYLLLRNPQTYLQFIQKCGDDTRRDRSKTSQQHDLRICGRPAQFELSGIPWCSRIRRKLFRRQEYRRLPLDAVFPTNGRCHTFDILLGYRPKYLKTEKLRHRNPQVSLEFLPSYSSSSRNSSGITIFIRHNTSVAGPGPWVKTFIPGTWMATGAAGLFIWFFAPTLAYCTTNFFSPNCMPFKPVIA